jgi:hypothetical protein
MDEGQKHTKVYHLVILYQHVKVDLESFAFRHFSHAINIGMYLSY